ncbi:MAG: HK97 gp10 family phage protein [Actinomycetia bacterium]|nr:HK97 gp10 family phage protein [Actinomycetes bacterium]
MSADVTQLAALGASLVAAGARVEAAERAVVGKAAADVKAHAQTRVPVRTGMLRGSITVTREGPLTALVGPTANYGRYVEYGTSRMAGRPYMGPAVDAVAPTFEQAVAAAAEAAL